MPRYNSRTFRFIKNALVPVPDKLATNIMYAMVFGRTIDWEHPDTLTSWINAQKIKPNSELPRYVDKIGVKQIVRDMIGEDYVIPMLWSGEDPDDIPFSELAYPSIIKSNNGSGQYFVMNAQEAFDRAELLRRARKWLGRKFGRFLRERFYDRIAPKLLIEPILKDSRGRIPDDLKVHMINGEVMFYQVIHDRFSHHAQSFYTPEWSRIYLNSSFGEYEGDYPRPERLDEVVRISKALSAPFTFVRVDLYACNEFIRFGELTFMPNAGFMQMFPKTMDKALLQKMGRYSTGGFMRTDPVF